MMQQKRFNFSRVLSVDHNMQFFDSIMKLKEIVSKLQGKYRIVQSLFQ